MLGYVQPVLPLSRVLRELRDKWLLLEPQNINLEGSSGLFGIGLTATLGPTGSDAKN